MVVSHIVLRLFFLGVFGLRYVGGGRSSRQKRSEAIGNFENLRKQNLSESSFGTNL